MRMRWIFASVALLAACGGGGKKKPVEPVVVHEIEKPKPPPPPPPVCVIAGAEQSLVGMVEADADAVKFCVSDGEANKCYAVDLAKKKYAELDEAPKGQSPVLDPDPARLETTAKEVKVCIGEDCKTVKPTVPKKSENPIDAAVNATGTKVAVLLGNAEKGKGTVELWDVATAKKIGKAISYAKGDYKCGEARMLGDTLYVSASVCAGPDARGTLYTLKGKKLADVGGKGFGTYGTVPLQVGETTWAFLDENGATIAIQDVATGKVAQTIDIGRLWAGDEAAAAAADDAEGADEAAPPAMGNPGESALVRGAEGKLVVVTGGPNPGSVGVVDLAGATLETTIASLRCEAPAATEEPAGGGDDEGGEGEGGDDDAGDE